MRAARFLVIIFFLVGYVLDACSRKERFNDWLLVKRGYVR